MIVSVHIPKTGGRSFQHDLAVAFGARLLADYGDLVELDTPEAHSHNAHRRAEMAANVAQIADHAMSSYEHALRSAQMTHPDIRRFHQQRMSAVDLIETYPDHPSGGA